METNTIWSRMGSWFKTATRVHDANGELPQLERDPGALSTFESSDTAARLNGRSSRGVRLPGWPLRRRNDIALEKLHDGFNQVAGLIESLRAHMAAQDTRSAEVSRSLAQLAGSLAQMPDLSRRQADTLGSIAAHLHAVGERTRLIEEALPPLVEGQRELVTVLKDKLDAGRRSDERMAASLDQFGATAASLHRASEATVGTLKLLESSSARRDEQTASLLTRQSRRLLIVFTILVGLGIAVTTVGIATLLR